MKCGSRLKKGFTMLEMLVVVGIIAILAGASMLGYSKIVKSAKKAKTQELVSNAATALTHILSANDGVWPDELLKGLKNGNGRLDADKARNFLSRRYNLLGLAYNQKDVGPAGTDDFLKNKTWDDLKLIGKDRCGVVDADAEAVLKRSKQATTGAKVPSGGTVEDHILYFAIDEDGNGFTEAQVEGGGTLKIRATAAVWAAGPDGKVDYGSYGRNDDVYSWRRNQVKK